MPAVLRNTRYVIGAALFVAAALFLLVFANATSPLYDDMGGIDGTVFYFVGKSWYEGHLPYVELFDHKGPLTYLFNLVGYAITGNRYGVWGLEVVSLFVTLVFVYRTFRLRLTRLWSIALTILSLLMLTVTLEGGNLTEEYILPWLAASYYYSLRWLVRNTDGGNVDQAPTSTHNAWYSALYGATFGIALMTRPTNALGLVGPILLLLTILLLHKQWRNVLSNFAAGIAGILIITVPFVLYFHSNGALHDFWDAAFAFNFEYADRHVASPLASLKDLVRWHKIYFPTWTLILIALLGMLVGRGRVIHVYAFVSALLPALWFWGGAGYAHYGQLVMPLIPLLFMSMHYIGTRGAHSLPATRIAACMIIMLAMYWSATAAMTFKREYRSSFDAFKDRPMWQHRVADFIDRTIGSDREMSILLYNIDPWVYEIGDIFPAGKYFFLQDMMAHTSERYRANLVESIETIQPQWIVLRKYDNKTIEFDFPLAISHSLETGYELIEYAPECDIYIYKALN